MADNGQGRAQGPGIGGNLLRAFLFGIVGAAIAFVAVPFQGDRNCRLGIREHEPQLTEAYTFDRAFATRLLDDHWVTGFVARSKDGSGAETRTVLCHFASKNFLFGRIEVLEGDQVAPTKEASRSLLNPLIWLRS